MKKCIFCGETEEEFNKDNCWTEEHIIPEALGNTKLKIFNVCKNCNSGLGMYVDNYFVNNMFIKMIRQSLGLKGQSGEIPNAFKEGKDKEGHIVRVDKNYQLTHVPYVEQDGTKVRVVASSKEEAKEIIQKKLSRMKAPKETIQKAYNEIDQLKGHTYQPEVLYDFTMEFNRIFMEALKIAFEYAVYKLGDNYLQDSRAKEIQHYLKDAIDGRMKKECSPFWGVGMLKIDNELSGAFEALNTHEKYHIILMQPTIENKLIVSVILFMCTAFSFNILISNDANSLGNPSFEEIIKIKTNNL